MLVPRMAIGKIITLVNRKSGGGVLVDNRR